VSGGDLQAALGTWVAQIRARVEPRERTEQKETS
jgi:hypothetical protein